MESHEPPWPDGRKQPRLDSSVLVPDPHQHTATMQPIFASSLDSRQSKKRAGRTTTSYHHPLRPCLFHKATCGRRPRTPNQHPQAPLLSVVRQAHQRRRLRPQLQTKRLACSFGRSRSRTCRKSCGHLPLTDSLDLGSSCLNVRSEKTAQHSTLVSRNENSTADGTQERTR